MKKEKVKSNVKRSNKLLTEPINSTINSTETRDWLDNPISNELPLFLIFSLLFFFSFLLFPFPLPIDNKLCTFSLLSISYHLAPFHSSHGIIFYPDSSCCLFTSVNLLLVCIFPFHHLPCYSSLLHESWFTQNIQLSSTFQDIIFSTFPFHVFSLPIFVSSFYLIHKNGFINLSNLHRYPRWLVSSLLSSFFIHLPSPFYQFIAYNQNDWFNWICFIN